MSNNEIIETSSSSEWFDATKVEQKPTRLSGIIFVLLSVIIVFATVAYGSVDPWALGFLSIGAGLIAILWLIETFITKQFSFNTNPLQLPIIGLILIGFIQLLPISSSVSSDLLSIPASSSLSIAPYLTQSAIILLFIYLVFFASALTFINSQSRLRKMVFILIVFGAIMAFFGTIQFLTGTESIYGIRPNRATSPFGSYANKHHFAALMEMLIGLTLGLLYGEATKKDKRLLLIIALVLMGIVVILTSSRGGLLSLLAVIGFVTFFNWGTKSKYDSNEVSDGKLQKKWLLIGGSFTFILILLGSVLLLGGGNELLRGTGIVSPTDITTGRSHFWSVALQVIKDNPIIGTGLDTFGNIFTKYDTWNGSMRVEQVHNDYLQILSDAGILGFICLIAFIYLLFKLSLNVINNTSDRFRRGVAIGALAGCFGMLFHSFFDFPLRTPSNPFIFLTLVVLATGSISYPKLYRKKRRIKKTKKEIED